MQASAALLFLGFVAHAFGGLPVTVPQRSTLQPSFTRSQAVSSAGDASFPVYGFDARSFGAVGDGKTDNTAALQATVNAAIAAGGGTILPLERTSCRVPYG